ncbi:glycosyltransferase [Nostocaceae cyanobacterium CENA357]|uniref:Glycosyltransferase n=1 Tax=Atlanticothrix silvestris CENA357 TaxID=1725252 RepID=A0A8J7HN25_9CYAN|nr:glycosyltransferase [Atlanticothrix silvestris]MBH8555310.1 glycosyltransferase [Atlanticothrix silvestris CENA357]
MKNINNKKVHFWFPNIFDVKGGIQTYLQALLIAATEYIPNLKIEVYNKLDKNKSKRESVSNHVDFHFYGNIPHTIRSIYFAVSLILDSINKRPNLILTGHINFAPVAYWIHRLIGIHYWVVVHGIEVWSLKNPIKQKALQSAGKILSVSGYTRDRLLKEQNLEPDQISLLPVTFDANRFEIAPKSKYLLERYGLTPDQLIILTVARLSSSEGYKGYDQVIRALPQIRQQIPNVHYLIVGKGNDRPRIEEVVQNLNLQNYVTLTGFIPDEELVPHYNLCDVFAMPSKGEGFGIVYLEALACGKPALGGNQDGAIDALCHGELGALVNPDDIEEIAQTLVQILQRTYPNALMYQPQALRSKVIETFGYEHFKATLDSYLDEYFQV